MHAWLDGSHDGAPGGQSALDTHFTHCPVIGLQRGVPDRQSPSTTHATQRPLARLHRLPPQSVSAVQTTHRSRVASQILASPTHPPPSVHCARHVRDVGSHVKPGEQSELTAQPTQMWRLTSQTGAVPLVHCAFVTHATH